MVCGNAGGSRSLFTMSRGYIAFMAVGSGGALCAVAGVRRLNRFGLVRHLARYVRLGGPSAVGNINSSYTIVSCTNGRIITAASLLLRNVRFSLACIPLGRLNCGTTVIGVSSVYTVGTAPARVLIDVKLSGQFKIRRYRRLCTNVCLTYRGTKISIINNSASTSLANLAVDVAYVNIISGNRTIVHDNTGRNSLVYIANSLNTTCVKLRLLRHRGHVFRDSNRASFRPSFTNGRCVLRHRLGPRTYVSAIGCLGRGNIGPATVLSIDSKLSSRLLRVYGTDNINYHICRRGVPVSCAATLVTRRFGVGLAAITLDNNRSCRLLFAIPLTSCSGIGRLRNIGIVNRVISGRTNTTLVAHSNRRVRIHTRN